MKRRWASVLIAASLTVVIALTFIYPHLMISPGPLVPAHASLATDCFACHAPFRGAVAERCVTCHVVADIGLKTTRGIPIARSTARAPFHQALTSQYCMACHADHAGPSLAATSRRPFSHSLLVPAMSAECATCHTPPANDVHSGLKEACGQCHTRDHWKPTTFDHGRYFVLDGDHNTACATCHINSDHSRYTCFGCHQHQPDGIREKHLEEGIRNFENCASCHKNAHDKASERDSREGGDD